MADVWDSLRPEVRMFIANKAGMPVGVMALTKVSTVFEAIYENYMRGFAPSGTVMSAAPVTYLRADGKWNVPQYNSGTAKMVKIT